MIKKLIAILMALVLPLIAASAEEKPEEIDLTYSSRGHGLYRLGNTGYLVEDCVAYLTDGAYRQIAKQGAELNALVPLGGDVKKYIYFIESSRSVRLDQDLSGENEVYKTLLNAFENDGHGTLALDSFADYANHFYMTDHHWKYTGSYQGYCDIIRMIFGEDEPLIEPEETVVFEEAPFNGSYNAELGYYQCQELFTVYRFPETVPYKAYNGDTPIGKYGRQDTYFKDKYPRITVYNHYGRFYGGDIGELILRTEQPDKPNLLLISNSYSNAIELLLTQHFNNIYKVDPRFYKLEQKTDMKLQKYIKQNEIDMILWMGDIQAFTAYFPLR